MVRNVSSLVTLLYHNPNARSSVFEHLTFFARPELQVGCVVFVLARQARPPSITRHSCLTCLTASCAAEP